MSGCGCEVEITDASQKKTLYWLLGINATLFVLEIVVGWIAQSTALIADSLDMLADAIVYGIALYAVGRAASDKIRAARWSGYFQGLLGLLILLDILRRMLLGSEPVSLLMIGMGAVALIGNLICLRLIYAHRHGDVHMRASWIFSANDVIANVGVILAGVLVMAFDTRWPDLIIGLIIALVVLRGAWRILADAREEEKAAAQNADSCGTSCCSSACSDEPANACGDDCAATDASPSAAQTPADTSPGR